MKPTHLILTAFLAASTLVQAATVDRRLPAPLPEFKTSEQLAQWREEKAAQANSPSQIPNSSLANAGAFFTGKPYLEESGTYAFLFRSYDPELNRWTTSDPSGFPDGANIFLYAPVPFSQLDPLGLNTIDVSRTTTTYEDYIPDWSQASVSWSDFLSAAANLASNFAGDAGTVASIAQSIMEQVTKEDPDFSSSGNTSKNFTYAGRDTIVGEWTPFDPAGFKIVKVHDPKITYKTRFDNSYDPDIAVFPKLTIITYFTETITIE